MAPTSLAPPKPKTRARTLGENVKQAQKYSSKSLGLGDTPNQDGDCHHTHERPNSLTAPAHPLGPTLTPDKVVTAIEHRRSPDSYLALALDPPTPALHPTNALVATVPLEKT